MEAAVPDVLEGIGRDVAADDVAHAISGDEGRGVNADVDVAPEWHVVVVAVVAHALVRVGGHVAADHVSDAVAGHDGRRVDADVDVARDAGNAVAAAIAVVADMLVGDGRHVAADHVAGAVAGHHGRAVHADVEVGASGGKGKGHRLVPLRWEEAPGGAMGFRRYSLAMMDPGGSAARAM